MKKLIVISVILFVGLNGFGQDTIPNNNKNLIYNYQLNIKMTYPCKNAKYNGTVNVTLDIDSVCRVHNIKQDIKIGSGCDELIQKSIKDYEKQIQKDFNNKCVKVNGLNLPIVFIYNP